MTTVRVVSGIVLAVAVHFALGTVPPADDAGSPASLAQRPDTAPGDQQTDCCLNPDEPKNCKDCCPGGNSCCTCCRNFSGYDGQMCRDYCKDKFGQKCGQSQTAPGG